MNKIRKITLAAGMAALGIGMAGQAQAVPDFIIDNFYTTPGDGSNASYSADDAPGGGATTFLAMPVVHTNLVMSPAGTPAPADGGFARTLSAEVTAGDSVSAQVCGNCAAAHHVSGAGGTNGTTKWIYEGPSTDLTGYGGVMFEYAADLSGANITFTFFDDVNDTAVVSSGALANTNNSSDINNPANRTPVSLSLPSFGGAGQGWADITKVEIEVAGVTDLDLTFDNAKLLPEPATLAILSMGLAGIGLKRCRRA